MYLIIENIQEQFELYFNNEKDIELIKKWAIRYIGYGEDLCFLSNEKYIVKWLEIFKNISDEIKDTDMRKLYNEFLEDLKKINIEYDKNIDELTKKYIRFFYCSRTLSLSWCNDCTSIFRKFWT